METLKNILMVLQIISAVLLSLSILLQARGSGLSATFGGTGMYYHEKRGAEKILSLATITLAILFIVSSYMVTVF